MIKREIIVVTGMVWLVSCDKRKVPLVNPTNLNFLLLNCINTLPREKVRRINKMINNGKMLRSFMKFSQLIIRQCMDSSVENLHLDIGAC